MSEPSTTELDAGTIAFAGRCFDLARTCHTAELEALTAQGLPANLSNDKGDTLLILASYHGHAATAAMLLARGADPDRHNDRGQTALAAAAFKGDERVVAALLEGGAAVDARGPDGRTALMTAAMFDRTGIVDLLLARGAGPGRVDAEGRSAADLAAKMGAYGTPRRLAAASKASVQSSAAPNGAGTALPTSHNRHRPEVRREAGPTVEASACQAVWFGKLARSRPT